MQATPPDAKTDSASSPLLDTATAPAALHADRTSSKCTAVFALVCIAALLAGTARVISSFGSREAETVALLFLLDGIFPRTPLVDGTASNSLALAFCASQGLLNGLSEMAKILEYFLQPPEKRKKSSIPCTSKTYWSSLGLAAINAATTAFSAANGMLLLFLLASGNPTPGVYASAIFFALVIFGSSTYFNWQKQLEGATQDKIDLKGAKKVLYPMMAGTSLLSNSVSTIYQSLLLLAFFKVDSANLGALTFAVAISILSSLNLAYAQLPAIKKNLHGSDSTEKVSYCSPRLPWYLPILLTCALTPFSSSLGLKDMLQAFTVLVIKLAKLDPPEAESAWYNNPAASWAIWVAGIILGLNAAYGLYAYRGAEAIKLINALLNIIFCVGKTKVADAAAGTAVGGASHIVIVPAPSPAGAAAGGVDEGSYRRRDAFDALASVESALSATVVAAAGAGAPLPVPPPSTDGKKRDRADRWEAWTSGRDGAGSAAASPLLA